MLALAVPIAAGLAFALRAPAPTSAPTTDLLLADVTVVNPGHDRQAHRDVVVRDGAIAAVRESARAGAGGASESVGGFVLPGLIDMHVHFHSAEAEPFALLLLFHGVTAVRDTGDLENRVFETRRAIGSGLLPGPRVFACGPFLDGDPPVFEGARVVPDAADAKRAVREIAAEGADCIKIYRRLSARAMAAVSDAAAEHRLPLVGHVPADVSLEEVARMDVQHLTGLPLVSERDERAGQRARVEATAAAWRELDPGRVDYVVRLSAERGLTHTPTLVFWQRYFRLLTARDLNDPLARFLPRYVQEIGWDLKKPWNESPEVSDALLRAVEKMRGVVLSLHEAGVRIHAGTDTLNPYVIPGESLHDELRNLVESGLSPEDAWKAATVDAADSLGHPELGRVRVGGPADLLVFRENPTAELENLETLELVIARGRAYSKRELEAALERYRQHFESPMVAALSSTWARIRAVISGTLLL